MEPIIEARERGYGTLIRVFPTYIEIKPHFRGAKVIPMRHVLGADLNWWKSKITIRTHEGETSLELVEAEEIQRAILQNLT